MMRMRTMAGFSLVVMVPTMACASADGQSEVDAVAIQQGIDDQESQCGPTWDLQHVERYDGSLGVSKEWVNKHQRPVGQGAGCTGTLVSEDLYLSAGHCQYGVGDTIRFNYQDDPNGNPRTPTETAVTEVVEQVNDGTFDYAVVRLSGKPGNIFGFARILDKEPVVGSTVVIIQHPGGEPKQIHSGTVEGIGTWKPNWFNHRVDTIGGTSGSGVLNTDGYLVGVHTNAGCMTGEPINGNSAIRMTQLIIKSPTLRKLAAGTSWEPVPGSSAQIAAIAHDPRARNTCYVGYDNGDVFRGSNCLSASPTWTKTDEWQTSGGIQKMVDGVVRDIAVLSIIPEHAIVGFAGTLQGSKLWMSGPAARTWLQVSNFPQANVGEILGISVNPLDQRVYVVGLNGAIAGRISGNSWTTVTSADPLKPASASGTVTSVEVDNIGHIWVGTSAGEIFATVDNGVTFTRRNASPYAGTPARPVIDMAVDPMGLVPPRMYVTFKGMQQPESVWVTANGGRVWANIHGDLFTTPAPISIYSMGAISVNPADSSLLYGSYTFDQALTRNGIHWQ